MLAVWNMEFIFKKKNYVSFKKKIQTDQKKFD